MANYKVVDADRLDMELTDIANAIREKTGLSDTMTMAEMAANVRKIPDLIVNTVSGSPISLTDSSDLNIRGLRLFGKTIQNGSPTLDTPVALESAGGSGMLRVSVGVSQEDSAPQLLPLPTPNGLPGIPVNSGGNYTDENGQQWICDEIDLARGVRVRNVEYRVFDGTEAWRTESSLYFTLMITEAQAISKSPGLCSACKVVYSYHNETMFAHSGIIYVGDMISKDKFELNLDKWKAFLAENKVQFMYALAEPVETPLTEEELAAYSALHTHYPNTAIWNDGGAGMELAYVADTKLYIDNQIAALSAAIVNG